MVADPLKEIWSEDIDEKTLFLNSNTIRSLSLQSTVPAHIVVTGVVCGGKVINQYSTFLPFIIDCNDELPDNYAFVYRSGLLNNIIGDQYRHQLTHSSLAKASLVIKPIESIVPASHLSLQFYGNFEEGPSAYYIKGCLFSKLLYPTPPFSPHLLRATSQLFLNYGLIKFNFSVLSIAPDKNKIAFALKTAYTKNGKIFGYSESVCEAPDETVAYYVSESTKITVVDRAHQFKDDHWLQLHHSVPYLSGLTSNLQNIMEKLMKNNEPIGEDSFLSCSSGIMVHGPHLAYKSRIVEHCAQSANYHFHQPCLNTANLRETLLQAVEKAKARSPTVILLKSSHCYFNFNEEDCLPNIEIILDIIEDIKGSNVLVVCTTEMPELLSPKLRKLLGHTFYVPLPSEKDRKDVLEFYDQFFGRKCCSGTLWSQEELDRVACQANYFSISELKRKIWSKFVLLSEEFQDSSMKEFILKEEIVPINTASGSPLSIKPTMWHSIQGYRPIKRALQTMVSNYRANPKDHPLQGLLLYGPPGCSKTMLVKALVTETKFSLFTLPGSHYLSMYVGETEKLIRSVFERALKSAPSILFIDELDNLCEARGRTEGSGDLVSEVKELMAQCRATGDGFTKVLLIGATNRPSTIDESLIQRGFFDQVVHVDLPNCEDRCAMWRHKIDSIPTKGEMDEKSLCQASKGFSGAEIEAAYVKAVRTMEITRYVPAVRRTLPKQQFPKPALPPEVRELVYLTQEEMMEAVSTIQPRTDKVLSQEAEKFTQKYKSMLLVS